MFFGLGDEISGLRSRHAFSPPPRKSGTAVQTGRMQQAGQLRRHARKANRHATRSVRPSYAPLYQAQQSQARWINGLDPREIEYILRCVLGTTLRQPRDDGPLPRPRRKTVADGRREPVDGSPEPSPTSHVCRSHRCRSAPRFHLCRQAATRTADLFLDRKLPPPRQAHAQRFVESYSPEQVDAFEQHVDQVAGHDEPSLGADKAVLQRVATSTAGGIPTILAPPLIECAARISKSNWPLALGSRPSPTDRHSGRPCGCPPRCETFPTRPDRC